MKGDTSRPALITAFVVVAITCLSFLFYDIPSSSSFDFNSSIQSPLSKSIAGEPGYAVEVCDPSVTIVNTLRSHSNYCAQETQSFESSIAINHLLPYDRLGLGISYKQSLRVYIRTCQLII